MDKLNPGNIKNQPESPFDQIKKADQKGNEFWTAGNFKLF